MMAGIPGSISQGQSSTTLVLRASPGTTLEPPIPCIALEFLDVALPRSCGLIQPTLSVPMRNRRQGLMSGIPHAP